MLPFSISDILGFKELILQKPIRDVFDHYMTFCQNAIMANAVGKDIIEFQFLSDSVFSYIENKKNVDIEQVVELMIRFLCCITHNSIISYDDPRTGAIPIRSAFSIDEYFAEKEIKVYANTNYVVPGIAGKAVVKAHLWEESQKWIGASIDPETYSFMNNNLSELTKKLINKNLIIEYDIPTKIGIVTSYAINFNIDTNFGILHKNLENMETLYKSNLNLLSKYKAAKRFLNYANDSKKIIPNGFHYK